MYICIWEFTKQMMERSWDRLQHEARIGLLVAGVAGARAGVGVAGVAAAAGVVWCRCWC